MNKVGKIDVLTSLRFFAAAAIVEHHCRGEFGLSALLEKTFTLSYGVTFFFVLSGFILAYRYPRLQSREEITLFLFARVARIWPLHLLTTFAWLFLVGWVDFSGTLLLINVLLLHAWIPIRDVYFSFNAVSWSISTELFFYILFPSLIVLDLWPMLKRVAIVFGSICGLISLVIITGVPAEVAFPGVDRAGVLVIGPLVRILEFCFGILTCIVYRHLNNVMSSNEDVITCTVVEIVALFIGAVAFLKTNYLISIYKGIQPLEFGLFLIEQLRSLGFSFLILVFALSRGFLSKLLSGKEFLFLGEISFAVYLVHVIILHWYRQYDALFRQFPNELMHGVYWVILVTLSAALYKGFEQPSRIHLYQFLRAVHFGGKLPHISLNRTSVIAGTFAICLIITLKFLPLAWLGYIPNQQAAVLIERSSWKPEALFGNTYQLLAVDIVNKEGQTFLNLIWKANQDTLRDYRFAVHYIGTSQELVGQADYYPDPHKGKIAAGTIWVDQIKLVKGTEKVAFAIYKPSAPLNGLPSDFLSVNSSNTDWNQRRLIINLSGKGS